MIFVNNKSLDNKYSLPLFPDSYIQGYFFHHELSLVVCRYIIFWQGFPNLAKHCKFTKYDEQSVSKMHIVLLPHTLLNYILSGAAAKEIGKWRIRDFGRPHYIDCMQKCFRR